MTERGLSAAGYIFLAPTRHGLARAAAGDDGAWRVEHHLRDHDVRCLAGDPLDPSILYAGAQGGGLFRSTDAGNSWQPAGLADHIVKAIAPSRHEAGVVYAGTKPALMYVSRDYGRTWVELEAFRDVDGREDWFSPAEPPDRRAYVNALALSPTHPQVVLAGIEFGAVLRSDDGGATWSNHLPGALRDCHHLRFHARDGAWVYEAGGDGGAAVSEDGGHTWRRERRGMGVTYGVACAADPEEPAIWYASAAPGPDRAYGARQEAYLYRASAAGWQPIGWQPHPLPHTPVVLVTDAHTPGQLYAALTNGDVWQGSAHGSAWQQLPFNLGPLWRQMVIVPAEAA